MVRLEPLAALVHGAFWFGLLVLGPGCGLDNRVLKLSATDSGADASDGDTGSLNGCTTANTQAAPADGVAATFTGNDLVGVYGPSGGAPTFTAVGGLFNVKEDRAAGPSAQYVGIVVAFAECIDASAFTGVAFTVSGSISGCTMQYSTQFTEDTRNDGTTDTDWKGSCRSSTCYSPQLSITPTSVATTIQAPWESALYTPGYPAPNPNDPAKLTSVLWQFSIPPAPDGGSGTCVADVTITNLAFYH
jgi:hypothetical protein